MQLLLANMANICRTVLMNVGNNPHKECGLLGNSVYTVQYVI